MLDSVRARFAATPPKLFHNPRAEISSGWPEDLESLLGREDCVAARLDVAAWPDYAPTPLKDLPGLAQAAGLASLSYKDEGGRFGLGSFKALGGPLAVRRLLARNPDAGNAAPRVTVACATDGNHGRAVAWAAQAFGCASAIYIHEGVSQGREDAIARYGARVVRVPGVYDDSLRRAQADSKENGWILVSDTAGDDFDQTQLDILQGYTTLADEALTQLGQAPTHIFVQGGVGGLAAAVCGHVWQVLGDERPHTSIVEPEKAACLYVSAVNGKPTLFPGDLETVMACLAAGEVNVPAWRILDRAADTFMTVPDEAAVAGMCLLAEGIDGDAPVVAGESGVAALAGLLAACADDSARTSLGLTDDSRVLVIGSEGATDPQLYQRIVGRSPDEVGGGS
ncbi:MAG: diaminopropionate ammonia-lyase [Rhodospirillales bacterium]|jgi:diaminopropionate ammonia-lyase|nr:diaminopropionate ammonia-lyase [Rhodospirillales bacterium]HJO97417.1 diaminopropionate ammonia-lyase [Rhodospirillales bacterium]